MNGHDGHSRTRAPQTFSSHADLPHHRAPGLGQGEMEGWGLRDDRQEALEEGALMATAGILVIVIIFKTYMYDVKTMYERDVVNT